MNGLVQYTVFRVASAVGMQIYSVKAFFDHDGGSDEVKRSNAGGVIHQHSGIWKLRFNDNACPRCDLVDLGTSGNGLLGAALLVG
jgi:hypothetical protein